MRGATADMGWVVLILISIAALIIVTGKTVRWYKIRRQRRRLEAEMHDYGI